MAVSMQRPEWACAEWGSEHVWHDCPECLAAFESLIESAQDDIEGDEPAPQPGLS